MGKQRISAEELAKIAGVSLSTVSRALSGKGRVGAGTRERIRKLAAAHGYAVNPLASTLFSEMRRQKGESFQGTLCWVNRARTADYWRNPETPWQRAYFEGARERAEELGFSLDTVWLGEPGLRAERLRGILDSRNVSGLIVPNMDPPAHDLALPWEHFAHVSIGRRQPELKCHRVVPDDYRNIQMAFARTRALGYRRVGGYVTGSANHTANGLFSAAFWNDYHEAGKEADAVRPMIDDGICTQKERVQRFGEWIRSERIEAVVGVLGETERWLAELGMRCPEDLGMVHLNLSADVAGWAGVDPQHRRMGAAAVDVVAARIYRNEVGSPNFHREVLIHGTWSDGWTLRKDEG